MSHALSTALRLVFLGPSLVLWLVWFPLGFWLDLVSWFGFSVPKSSKPRFHRLRELLLDQGWIATLNELPSLRFGWGDLISKLEVLERWHSQEEEGRGAQASARGYKRGGSQGTCRCCQVASHQDRISCNSSDCSPLGAGGGRWTCFCR